MRTITTSTSLATRRRTSRCWTTRTDRSWAPTQYWWRPGAGRNRWLPRDRAESGQPRNKDAIAVIDANTAGRCRRTDVLGSMREGCAGSSHDVKNPILGSPRVPRQAQHDRPVGYGQEHPAGSADQGQRDGATFNAETMEAFSSQGDGTLTVIKGQDSPTSFA